MAGDLPTSPLRANPHWPLFDLVVRTPRVALRTPDDAEAVALADLAAEGIHDPTSMPFAVAWTDVDPPQQQRNTCQHLWRNRAEWTPEQWQLSLAVYDLDPPGGGGPVLVGVQGIGADDFPLLRTADTGSWLGRAHQGRGLGREMRAAVLHLAFAGLGARACTTGAWHDNEASLRVTRSLPYRPNGEAWGRRRERAERQLLFRMARHDWEPVARDDITIDGLEGCRAMFGLDAPAPAGPAS